MRAEPKPHITAFATDASRGMYRFTIPIRALIEQGMATGNVSLGPTQSPTIARGSPLVLQDTLTLAPSVVAAAKKNHCRMVYDIDKPYWFISGAEPNGKPLTSAQVAARDMQLSDGDLLTASTLPLVEGLRKRGLDAVVLPTTVDPRNWSVQPRRAERRRTRIGWHAPKFAHLDESRLINDVVTTLIDEADFVVFGDIPPALTDAAPRIERHSPVQLSFFPVMLAALDLDLILVPLALNEFNECRSNLSLLQAGMLGYAVLGTDIEPHRTLPVTRLTNSSAAWITAIRERIHESAAVQREGEMLRHAVHEGFLSDVWAPDYLSLWTGETRVPALA